MRLIWIGLSWLVAGPLMVFLWSWMGWWSLIALAMMLWTTWDYYQRGGMAEAVDEGVSRAGAWITGPWEKDS
jgi:hypothetical protein